MTLKLESQVMRARGKVFFKTINVAQAHIPHIFNRPMPEVRNTDEIRNFVYFVTFRWGKSLMRGGEFALRSLLCMNALSIPHTVLSLE